MYRITQKMIMGRPQTLITLTQGNTLNVVVNMRRPDGSVFYPATGDEVVFNCAESRDSDEPVLTKEIPHDTMTLTLDPSDTEGLDCGRYVFDITLYTDDVVDTFIEGVLTIEKRTPVIAPAGEEDT